MVFRRENFIGVVAFLVFCMASRGSWVSFVPVFQWSDGAGISLCPNTVFLSYSHICFDRDFLLFQKLKVMVGCSKRGFREAIRIWCRMLQVRIRNGSVFGWKTLYVNQRYLSTVFELGKDKTSEGEGFARPLYAMPKIQ